MTVDIDGRTIRTIDANNQTFRKLWAKLPPQVQIEAEETLKSLLFKKFDALPAKLHFHQLVSKKVPSRADSKKSVNAWSLHLTADDRYKASFTFEDGAIYLRTCDKHDTVDKSP